jgi:hypothetical protein
MTRRYDWVLHFYDDEGVRFATERLLSMTREDAERASGDLGCLSAEELDSPVAWTARRKGPIGRLGPVTFSGWSLGFPPEKLPQ